MGVTVMDESIEQFWLRARGCSALARRNAAYVEERIRFWMKCGFTTDDLSIGYSRDMDKWLWLPKLEVMLEPIEAPP